MTDLLSQSLELPCGATLTNRLAKSAMSEGMANSANHSTPRLETLYRRWASSGAGLLLTGNIQIDRWHLERPGNIVIDDTSGRRQLAALAHAGISRGAHFWAQISHTGRQVSDHINPSPLSCSDVEIDFARNTGFSFGKPKPMTEEQIYHAIDQYAFAAREVKEAGFTGIVLHAAHGYLISQFLSPLTNRRKDGWGGALENRARFLLAVITEVRRTVGPRFPIAIKLNASDFQRGGFTNAECIELVQILNSYSLDLLELSGGSLEQPKLVGVTLKDEGEDGERARHSAREAYFVAFAGAVRKVSTMPVMVTGNFRSASGMAEALVAGELDLIGLGRPLIADPDAPRRLLAREIDHLPSPEATLNPFHILPWNNMQLERLGDGLDPDLSMNGESAFSAYSDLESSILAALLKYRRIQVM